MDSIPPFSLTQWHALSTFGLFGLIWVVQLAIYPLFSKVGRDRFCEYHEAYCARIAWVVAPLMFIELLSALALLFVASGPFGRGELWWGLAAIVGVWMSTAFLSVPAHRRLIQGFDERAFRRLVWTNWIRTGLWSARAIWIASSLSQLGAAQV